VFIVLLFQENKSFGASTICIHPLMYVKPCREQLCTLALTRRHLQALVALSFAFVSDIFRFNFTLYTSLATTSQALFASDFA
jgi:hypothetical protein